MDRVRTRFAPSPTGFMHIGNLRTCLYGYLFAKKNGGDFVLRIEDTDQERFVEGAIEAIYRTLKISGIEIDEGPLNGGNYGPYIQSERKKIYLDYAKKLVDLGGAYYCFCTKERLQSLKEKDSFAKYDKHCLHLSKEEIEANLKAGIPYVIRQNIPEDGISEYEDMVFGTIKINNEEMEDNILIKSDGMPTYNFANVIDDHLMKISHVMRGMEYLSSTPKYNLIYDAFGWERPKYIHMPPIMRDEKNKLSKRHGDANFEDFYQKGYLSHAIVNYIALLGWHPHTNQEKMTMEELIDAFDISGISKSGAIFDLPKMNWLNSEYIKEMDSKDFMELSLPYYNKSDASKKYDYSLIAPLMQNRIEKFDDIKEKIDFIVEFNKFDLSLFENKKNKITRELAIEILELLIPELRQINEWQEDILKDRINQIAQEKELKAGRIFLTMRVAVSGVQSTPGGATELACILGKDETISRMEQSLSWLKE